LRRSWVAIDHAARKVAGPALITSVVVPVQSYRVDGPTRNQAEF